MKSIKLFLTVSFMFANIILFAQPQGRQGGGGGREQGGPPPIPDSEEIEEMVEKLAKGVFLTDEQEQEVLSLYVNHFEEVSEMVSGSSKPDRSEMEALNSDLKKEVKKLLREDQEDLYDDYLKKNKKQRERPSR